MPAFLPTGGATKPDADFSCGTLRNTMKTNPLLAKAEVGKIKKMLFNNPAPEQVFGNKMNVDPEGAREVTMIWKEHQPNPDDKPGPDFRAMNKLAATSGLTSAKELPDFRTTHRVTLRKGESLRKQPPALPSDRNPAHTYGKPASFRTAEEIRSAGPQEPPMKHLIQSAYQYEWVAQNMTLASQTGGRHSCKIPSGPTKASLGHAKGADALLNPQTEDHTWKMAQFTKTAPRVTQYMGPSRGTEQGYATQSFVADVVGGQGPEAGEA